MKLIETPISDLFYLERPVRRDDRGFFTRLFGQDEIAAAGRSIDAYHVNSSMSTTTGTLRGIHFQYPPYAEEKVVSCIAGSIWDVAVDLRPNSPTRFQWFGIELTPSNGLSLIVPKGFGHAFITLEPNTTVIYVVTSPYRLSHESGIRYDDSKIDISWPITPSVLSPKDLSWPPVNGRLDEFTERFSELSS